jgi:hypothetical protein
MRGARSKRSSREDFPDWDFIIFASLAREGEE